MGEVSGIVVEVQRIQVLVVRQRATALQYSSPFESLADFRVEHDKCFLWISEIYFDLAGRWSSLGADSDELRSCGVNGTVGGYWGLLERASGDSYLWDDMTNDERAVGRDEHIRRRR